MRGKSELAALFTSELASLSKLPSISRAWAAALALAAGWAVLFLYDPVAKPLLPACPFHILTGLYCPGCGATRALHQLARGHLRAALQLNALAICGLLPGLWFALRSKPARMPQWTQWAIFCAILVFGVIRNIPVHPFDLLAP